MLTSTHGFSGFSVKDIDAAYDFYSGTLGLEVSREEMGLLGITLPGGAVVMAYPKDDHEPAVFTILNFQVDDIDAAVDGLAESGVTFDRYDGFEQDDKGVARGKAAGMGPDIAWFRDPSGNILAVMA